MPSSRNRGRNRRRRQRRAQNSNIAPIRNLGLVDKEVLSGTWKLIDSLFGADTGISRGIAFGSQYTALCDVKSNIELAIPAGSFTVFAIQTDALASAGWAASANGGTTAGAITNGAIVNPFNTTVYPTGVPGLSTSSIEYAGPFNTTNPANDYRVVSLSVLITPDTNLLNQGGWVKVAHIPTLANGLIVYGAGGVNYAGPGSFQQYVNSEQIDTFRGTEAVLYHWYPNDDEITINTAAETELMQSGPLIIIQAPSTAAVSVNLDIRIGIEYVANDTIRPLVHRILPTVHPNAQYEMNQYVAQYWKPMVIGCKSAWEKMRLLSPKVQHEHLFTGLGTVMLNTAYPMIDAVPAITGLVQGDNVSRPQLDVGTPMLTAGNMVSYSNGLVGPTYAGPGVMYG
jgi:hypothetical protein